MVKKAEQTFLTTNLDFPQEKQSKRQKLSQSNVEMEVVTESRDSLLVSTLLGH